MKKLVFLCVLLSTSLHARSEVDLRSSDGVKIHGEFYEADHPEAMMLVVHGLQSHAGWYLSGEDNAEAGISSFAFDRRGSGKSLGMRGHAEGTEDFMNDFAVALRHLKEKNSESLPIHVMANSLGAVVALNYFYENPQEEIASLILTTPGTHSTDEGDYPLWKKALIFVSPDMDYFESPIDNEHFVSEGPYLDWINADKLGGRKFTASFLRTVNSMKQTAEKAAKSLNIPLFLLLANQDAVIDNRSVEREVFNPYRGDKKIKKYNSEHYLFFGKDRDEVSVDIQNWILQN